MKKLKPIYILFPLGMLAALAFTASAFAADGLAWRAMLLPLNDFFYKIGNPAPADFKVKIPDNFLFQGYRGFSMDFFGSATPYLQFLRAFLTATCFILTAIVCYNKLRKFFTEEG